MGMRNRYDSDGKLVGAHNMIFDDIPDDYVMKTVLTGDKFCDWSYVGIMKHLRTIQAGEEFEEDKYYSLEVLSHMALDYLKSAQYLYGGIVNDRDGNTVSYYLVPCAFACKHSIELKLKECQIEKGFLELKGHSVLKIWNDLDEMDIPHSQEISNFLEEVEKIDNNEMALRYGVSGKLAPLQEKFKFDIDNMISNTMFLFNVVDEYIICKYRNRKNNS